MSRNCYAEKREMRGAKYSVFIWLGIVLMLIAACSNGHDGYVSEKGKFIKGQKSGVWKGYYFSGAKRYKGRFEDGLEKGKWVYWYENGHIKELSWWRDGQRNGPWSSYYEDGGLNEQVTWLRGKRTGEWKKWHADGSLMAKGRYDSDVRIGLFTEWYSDGVVRSYTDWSDGVGAIRAFYKNGKTDFTGHYSAGHKDGLWRFYDSSGHILKEELYRDGHLLKEG